MCFKSLPCVRIRRSSQNGEQLLDPSQWWAGTRAWVVFITGGSYTAFSVITCCIPPRPVAGRCATSPGRAA